MDKNVSGLKKSAHNFLSFIRSYDNFGKPVGLTIDGESEFKTLYGGAASIGLSVYLIYILVF
jgi:hypothetical protein